MTLISASQMELLGRDFRRAGNLRMARYIDERFPGIFVDLDVDERIAVVEKYRVEAARFGFRADDEIGCYMDLVAMYGAPFPNTRWFRPIMFDDTLSAAQKIRRIKSMLRDQGVAL